MSMVTGNLVPENSESNAVRIAFLESRDPHDRDWLPNALAEYVRLHVLNTIPFDRTTVLRISFEISE